MFQTETRYSFKSARGIGLHFRELSVTSYQAVTLDGKHIGYVRSEVIEYAPTIAEQLVRSRNAD